MIILSLRKIVKIKGDAIIEIDYMEYSTDEEARNEYQSGDEE